MHAWYAQALATLSLIVLSGCQGNDPASNHDMAKSVTFNPEGVKVLQPVPGQRFTPTTSALVSFDTQTGQLCRTYDWGERISNPISSCYQLALYDPTETAKNTP